MKYLLILFTLVGSSLQAADSLTTVASVDVNRYLGKWYEIARLPFGRQEGCFGTTATYSLREDKRIKVINSCRDESFEGKDRTAEGVAKVVDPQTNAKLEVQFFWPFWGDYWILALDPDYKFAMVGEPKKRYLWILSRTPRLPESTLTTLLEKARAEGYDLTKLSKTPQKDN